MDRYYIVYEFEKDGYLGRGATSGILFGKDGPSSEDIIDIAGRIREQYSYDKVMILSWQKLSDEIDDEIIAQAK